MNISKNWAVIMRHADDMPGTNEHMIQCCLTELEAMLFVERAYATTNGNWLYWAINVEESSDWRYER